MAECCNKYVNNLACTCYVTYYVVLNADHKQETDVVNNLYFVSMCILLLQQYY